MGFFDDLFGRGNQIKPTTATTRRFGIPASDTLRDVAGTKEFRTLAQRSTQAALGQDPKFGGFGEDFLSRATNPAIQGRLNRLREVEIPEISSAASARGLGRSTIATGQIQRAGTEASRDIDQLVSNFFVLNEAQRKTDINQGIGVGERQQNFELLSNQARANLDTTDINRNLNVQQANQTTENAAQARLLQTVLAAAGAGAGALGAGGAGVGAGGGVATGQFLAGGTPTSTFGPQNVPSGFEGRPSGVANIAGGGGNFLQNFVQNLLKGNTFSTQNRLNPTEQSELERLRAKRGF